MSPQTFFFSLSKFSFFLTPPHSRLYFQFHHVVSVTRPSLSARRTAPSSLSFSFSQKAENSAGKSPEDSSVSPEHQFRKKPERSISSSTIKSKTVSFSLFFSDELSRPSSSFLFTDATTEFRNPFFYRFDNQFEQALLFTILFRRAYSSPFFFSFSKSKRGSKNRVNQALFFG